MLSKIAIAFIYFYKNVISPHKGYSCKCGHKNGLSCSSVAIELIKKFGVFKALPSVLPLMICLPNDIEDAADQRRREAPDRD